MGIHGRDAAWRRALCASLASPGAAPAPAAQGSVMAFVLEASRAAFSSVRLARADRGPMARAPSSKERVLVRCEAMETPLDLRPGSNFAFATRPVSVLIRLRVENGNSG